MAELSAEKRILIAFALSFLVLALWTRYMQKRLPPPPPPAVTPPAPAQAPPPSAKLAMPAPKVGGEEREIVVETDVARLVFSTRGAVVKSWALKHHKDAKGQPLDLVHAAASAQLGYPLSLAIADDAPRENLLNQALFVASTPASSGASKLEAPAEISFEYSYADIAASKRLRFANGYVVEVETQVLAGGQAVPHSLAWRGGFGDVALETAWADTQVVWRAANEVVRRPARKISGTETATGAFAYAGLEDRYFAAIFLPPAPATRVTAQHVEWTPAGAEKPQAVINLAVEGPPSTTSHRQRLFVGPKALDLLARIQPAASPRALDELVDFGWFAVIAKPLFLAMRWLHDHWIPNYGWAIVILTVIINMGLFPLKWKSMLSAWKLQKIAPQMRAIQEKYKKYRFNDPRKQEMQRELMALYREHGVNPLGGCFPLLLQLPFFYAFYKVLVVAIEMRHAPWFGWIQDLAARDPYYILPVAMTATMYISTRMTPMTSTDPAQQKLMRLMPLMFGVIFLTVSSGLVLYWFVSNLVGIGQQWWINRQQQARTAAEKAAGKKKKRT